MTTIAQISDLHFGADQPEVVEGLLRDLNEVAPSLVVVSGDLTQRARREEFIAARSFLDRIPCGTLVVPGNHDIPLLDVVDRFLRPLARFRRYIHEDVDPFIVMDGVAVMGLNTARSNTWKNGRISVSQIESMRARFEALPPGVLKVLVTHHPFLPPPGDTAPPIVGRAMEALRAAEACGIDVVLAGHLHHGYTGDVRTVHTGIRRAILVGQAGTATSHRVRNEPNSYNVLSATPDRLAFSLRVWNGKAFAETRTAHYIKVAEEWTPAAP